MPGFARCLILNRMARKTSVADAFSDLQVGFSGIFEKLGKFRTDIRVLLEQQPFEHDAVDADHLLQMGSEKVHDNTRFAGLIR